MVTQGSKLEQSVLESTWLDYKLSGCPAARNQLVLHYISLVRVVAIKIGTGLPPSVDREDLVSYGLFGLLDALDKFDSDKGVRFETYAASRIRGSILDEIRSLDWVPRTVRAKARDVQRAESELQARLGRPAEESELAAHLGVNLVELAVLRSQAHATPVTGLEEFEEGGRGWYSGVTDPASNPEDLYLTSEVVHLVAEAIESMSERSKTILVLYYLQEMTLAEIGNILGVTESRVCQLQSKLLQTLKGALGSQHVVAA